MPRSLRVLTWQQVVREVIDARVPARVAFGGAFEGPDLGSVLEEPLTTIHLLELDDVVV